MKVLVATSKGQGKRGNDFSWTEEGEYASIGLICRKDKEDPDGGCGCGRAWIGIKSHKATTTAEVVERDISKKDLVILYHSSDEQAGWSSSIERTAELVTEILEVADLYPVGTILEKRLEEINIRS